MKEFIALFLMFSIFTISVNLYAKEKRGANLIIQKKDDQQVKGELIAVKETSLLLKEKELGVDVSVDIGDIKVIRVLKKSKALERAGLGILIGGGSGALVGYLIAGDYPRGRVAAFFGAIGAGIGLVVAGLASEKGEDETIQIEGKPSWYVIAVLAELKNKARIPNYK